MNTQEINKTAETSDAGLLKTRLRFVKDDLSFAMDHVDKAKEQLNDEELQTSLETAYDLLDEVLGEIQEREEKVENLIRSIAS